MSIESDNRKVAECEFQKLSALLGSDGLDGLRFSVELHEFAYVVFGRFHEEGDKHWLDVAPKTLETCSPEKVEDVVRHEYAHYLHWREMGQVKNDHGPEWQALCLLTGAVPTYLGIDEQPPDEVWFDLYIRCDNCYGHQTPDFCNEGDIRVREYICPLCRQHFWARPTSELRTQH
ncbi:MAG TPA: SprT-like domain-containing protein [Acidimicrobiia bacterium]|nr:SprT-like domain-containing protein [Acidimicrobiia bacterium]